MLTADPPAAVADAERPPRRWVQVLLGVVIALIVAMWIYAFAFAKREGINRIEDRDWAARGEQRCAEAKAALLELRDPRTIEEVGDGALAVKAGIVEQTNVILATMIDAIAADTPADDKGRRVVPLWIADYRTYLADRVAMVASLRAGENVLLNETEVKGTPISYFVNDFARQNDMDSCTTPIDLAV